MTPQAARSKGRRAENYIAQELGSWYYGDLFSLERTTGSRSKKGYQDQCGDLGVAKSELPYPWVFSVEIKHRDYPKWKLDDILTKNQTSLIYESWIQCKKAAREGGKFPLLILKRNWFPLVVGMNVSDYIPVINSKGTRDLAIHVAPWNLTLFFLSTLITRTSAEDWVQRWRLKHGRTT